MAAPSVTYTFTNGTTADATQVNQNFTDIINGVSDGTKDLTVSALTAGGTVSFTGTSITFGNASSDLVTFVATIDGGVTVDGSSDEVQLTIQGNATQTSDIFVVENSAGADRFIVTNTAVEIPAGTVSVPGIGFIDDADGTGTGLYRVGADTIGFTTAGTKAGEISSAGLWTIGPAVTNNFQGAKHIVSGKLYSGNVTSTDASGEIVIGANVRFGSSNGHTGRSETATGGAGLLLDTRTSNTAAAFALYTNLVSDATSTDATIKGQCTHAGAWTLGNSSTAVTHIAQNTTTTAGVHTLTVQNNTTSSGSNDIAALCVQKGYNDGTAGNNWFVHFKHNAGGTNSGYIGTNGANAAAFFSTSDARLKKDVSPLTSALEKVTSLRPVHFTWIEEGQRDFGFIAQEFAEVFPQMVHKPDDQAKHWTMSDSKLVPYLVAAIKELKAEIELLKKS
jgi:hypothetical protein